MINRNRTNREKRKKRKTKMIGDKEARKGWHLTRLLDFGESPERKRSSFPISSRKHSNISTPSFLRNSSV